MSLLKLASLIVTLIPLMPTHNLCAPLNKPCMLTIVNINMYGINVMPTAMKQPYIINSIILTPYILQPLLSTCAPLVLPWLSLGLPVCTLDLYLGVRTVDTCAPSVYTLVTKRKETYLSRCMCLNP